MLARAVVRVPIAESDSRLSASDVLVPDWSLELMPTLEARLCEELPVVEQGIRGICMSFLALKAGSYSQPFEAPATCSPVA